MFSGVLFNVYLRQHFDVALLYLAVGAEVDLAQLRAAEEEGVGGGEQREELELLRLVVEHLRLRSTGVNKYKSINKLQYTTAMVAMSVITPDKSVISSHIFYLLVKRYK